MEYMIQLRLESITEEGIKTNVIVYKKNRKKKRKQLRRTKGSVGKEVQLKDSFAGLNHVEKFFQDMK